MSNKNSEKWLCLEKVHLFEVPGVFFCWGTGEGVSLVSFHPRICVWERNLPLLQQKPKREFTPENSCFEGPSPYLSLGPKSNSSSYLQMRFSDFRWISRFFQVFFVQVTGDNPAVEGLRVYQTAWYLRLAETPLLSPPFFSIFPCVPCVVETKINAV